ncbi:MAG TPA: hypothetical protein VIK52_08460 [Opitutaceae bacterium]
MKQLPRLTLWVLAGLTFSTALHADDRAVFSFKGSNAFETIEGILVLNRSATRTATASGFTFASPVEALHYVVTEGASVNSRFTFTAANPNSLAITKGAGGSTSFLLFVEPVPTDPPFPGPLAFSMEFSFPGAAPWGDWVPDRTISGAQNMRLGAHDLFEDSVSIVETNREVATIEVELQELEAAFAAAFKNPGFHLPGTTPSERVAALVMGIEQLSTGQRKQLHGYLNAAP